MKVFLAAAYIIRLKHLGLHMGNQETTERMNNTVKIVRLRSINHQRALQNG